MAETVLQGPAYSITAPLKVKHTGTSKGRGVLVKERLGKGTFVSH